MPNTASNTANFSHIPVMLHEAVDALRIQPGKWYVDATFGLGGHSKEIMKRGGHIVGIDHDEQAIERAKKAFATEIADGKLVLSFGNFTELQQMIHSMSKEIDGILFDFGINSTQLDDPTRGFSFQEEGPLDMRMDSRLGVKAMDLVNALGRKELYDLFTQYAQEYRARTIVDAIFRARVIKPIQTTTELAAIVEKAVGGREKGTRGHLHPATKVFMALRMVVNDELNNIKVTLPIALDVVRPGGRIVTISFHEGEDRIVKQWMNAMEQEAHGMQETKKPIVPSLAEEESNPRARSAKLRVFVKNQ